MPSASVALLAALVTGKGRPKRLLVPANAPAFIANIGLIIGAATVSVAPEDVDLALTAALRTEGLRPEQVWAVAVHREGKLSPTDWLSRCAARGIPTMELCIGSLFALAQWSPFPATFTIVDLEAEEAFAGTRVAALLTGDRALAARVRQLCLPAAEAQDYILDAMPRGLAHDETALAELVEQVIALDGEKPPSSLRFQPPAARAAASQAERDSNALAESRKKVDELQRTIDQWEARFDGAEAEAAKDAEILSRARADLLKHRNESERALAAAHAEKETLAQRLLRTERERDLAVADAARRDESDRGSHGELKQRVAQFEKAATASADREARQAASEEASRARMQARISRLEADGAAAENARAELLRQKTQAEGDLASMRAEKEILARKLADLDSHLGEARKDAARRAAAQEAALDEQTQRAAQLEKDVATLTAREAARLREWTGSKGSLAERIVGLEKERDGLATRLSALERDRDQAAADAARREESQGQETAEQRQRAKRLERETAALREREAKLTAELETSRAALSEQASRLAAAALASKSAAHLRAGRAADETALAEARAVGQAVSDKLAEAERSEAALRQALDEQKQRADRLEKDGALLKENLARQASELEAVRVSLQSEKAAAVKAAGAAAPAGEWESERASMSERIARLEASAAEAENAHADLVKRMAAESEGAIASSRAEAEAVARKLVEVEKDRDLVRTEAERRDAARRAALEEQRQRVYQLEKELSVRRERETQLTDEWALVRAEMSDRIARMEAAAVAADQARADVSARKAEGDQAGESIRAEREALGVRLRAMEKDHALALADAARREDAQRLALDAEKRRAAQLAGEAAALVEREASQKREWEDTRAEWSERIRKLEAAAATAGNANVGLMARKNEAEQARASLQAELEEQMRLAQQLKMEAATAAAREVKKFEVLRADLEARIAKLEAGEVIADKARTELLNRKRDSDRALAEAQAERAALLKKLATIEHERDQALARGGVHGAGPDKRPAGGDLKGDNGVGGERNTGGLSALVGLWNTAVIKRPGWSKEQEEKPQPASVDEVLGVETILGETPPASVPAPAPEMAAPPRTEAPAASAAARKDADRVAPANSPTGARDRITGGLSALVNLWNTAATMRPFKRKEAEGKPDVDPVMGIELIPDEAPSSSAPPVQGAAAPPRPDRPAPVVRARPNPLPRRPEPKPAPAPDETEKLGGWLRDLAGRVRGKPK